MPDELFKRFNDVHKTVNAFLMASSSEIVEQGATQAEFEILLLMKELKRILGIDLVEEDSGKRRNLTWVWSREGSARTLKSK